MRDGCRFSRARIAIPTARKRCPCAANVMRNGGRSRNAGGTRGAIWKGLRELLALRVLSESGRSCSSRWTTLMIGVICAKSTHFVRWRGRR